ncbi:MAG: hypothetical protein ACPG4T_14655 [Nannocystaceae bacterium]
MGEHINAPDDRGLLARAGLLVMEQLLPPDSLAQLRAEALALESSASESHFEADSAHELRGGRPAMSLRINTGGSTLQSMYKHPSILSMIERLAARAISPSGPRGCFNYYTRPCDHMGLHRDTEGCEVTLITCLVDAGARKDSLGGALRIYRDHISTPLSGVRALPVDQALHVRLRVGESLLMLGGALPHALLPIDAGQRRVVSALCYNAS